MLSNANISLEPLPHQIPNPPTPCDSKESIYHGFHAGFKTPPRPPPISSTIFILLVDRKGSIELLLPDPTLAIAFGGLDLWRNGLSESASLPSATRLVVASILLLLPVVSRDAGLKAELPLYLAAAQGAPTFDPSSVDDFTEGVLKWWC